MNATFSKLAHPNFFGIFKWIIRGKSISRACMNNYLEKQNIELTGNIIDLGAKSDKCSYFRFFRETNPIKFTYSDLYSSDPNICKVDLEKKFSIKTNSYDTVLLFNVIEHIYNTDNLLSEISRILKNNGKMIGIIPFMVNYHPDPNDYHRYTHSALNKKFKENGFDSCKIVTLYVNPFIYILQVLQLPTIFNIIFYIPLYVLDIIFKIIWNIILRRSFRKIITGYYFNATVKKHENNKNQ